MWRNFSCGPQLASALEKYKFCVLWQVILCDVSPARTQPPQQKAKSDFLLFCASARAPSSGTCCSRRDQERESTLSGGAVLGPCADRYCIYDIFLRHRAQWARVCATESRFYCTLRHCPQRDEMKLITAAFSARMGWSFSTLVEICVQNWNILAQVSAIVMRAIALHFLASYFTVWRISHQTMIFYINYSLLPSNFL